MAAAAAASANPGVVSRLRQWVLGHLFSSSWLLLAPLLAAYGPHQLFQTYFKLFLRRHARRLRGVVDPYLTVDVFDTPPVVRYSGLHPVAVTDTTYEEVKAYLSGTCSQDARELRAEGAKDGDGLVISMRDGEDVADEFAGATLWWSSVLAADPHAQQHHYQNGRGGGDGGSRLAQRLTFHKRHRRLVLDEYLPHVRRRGREILFANRRRRLYTNNRNIKYSYLSKPWSYVNLDHPTTFETLAMEPAKKKEIMDDLDAFRSSRDFYRRAGKPWKRGYLLYGPPGTGKSTMIAAMANYDIYDVELTTVRTNNELRKILIETTSKSIIVIEDIDCSLDLTASRAKKPTPPAATAAARNPYYEAAASGVTLSGLLNFIDGLWSSTGGERIVVFTTNHVDKLDPALVRRGRMDMHIEMSYCGFEAFRTLAKNYLSIDEHRLFGEVEEQLREVEITPADVAECLMTAQRAGHGADSSMELLVETMKKKKEEAKLAAAKAAAAAAKRKVKAAAVKDEQGDEDGLFSDEVEEEDGQEFEFLDDEEEEEDGQEIEFSDEVQEDGQETKDSPGEVKEEDAQESKDSSDEVEKGEQETDDSSDHDEVEKDGQETKDSSDR